MIVITSDAIKELSHFHESSMRMSRPNRGCGYCAGFTYVGCTSNSTYVVSRFEPRRYSRPW